ncbi:MAG: acetyl-CoA decarbonylase/synthase complex subunit delta [Planctomycetota bacterium]|nr:acetyl-CoA decarbonylase/synthase complex subunit delta [Planctomycetota bacterium]
MPLPAVQESYSGRVNEVTLGGGTRKKTLTIGGAKTIVYGGDRAVTGNRPVIAIDVLDAAPQDWAPVLAEAYGNVLSDPAAWAKKAVEEFGADLVCVKFDGIHPDKGNLGAAEAVVVTKKVIGAVGVPVILWGSGNDEKDNAVMPKVSEVAKGEKVLLGTVTQDNYKSLTATALADGHLLIAQAPLDINIAKQVNILVSDMGFPLGSLVMFQTTGTLGYGMEYAYSIQERERLAALTGDKLMAAPVICDVGFETWRCKESKADLPQWGDAAKRGPLWEATTAVSLLQSGVDIVRMRHPGAVAVVKAYIDSVWGAK